MKSPLQMEVDSAREHSRFYQMESARLDRIAREAEHKLRLKTIAFKHVSALLWFTCGAGIADVFINSPGGKAVLNATVIVACAVATIITMRAKKRACKEFGHA